VSLRWGARFGHIEANATGIALVHIVPNPELRNWANTTNGDINQLATNPAFANARADLAGAAIYSLPTVGIAERVSPAGSPTRIEAGVRVKLMRAIYTHYIVDKNNIVNNTAAASAPDL